MEKQWSVHTVECCSVIKIRITKKCGYRQQTGWILKVSEWKTLTSESCTLCDFISWNLLWGLSHLAVFKPLPPHGLYPTMRFSKQEYWSGLSFPPPGGLSHPGIKSEPPALAGRFFNHCTTGEAPRQVQWERVRSRIFFGTWLMGWLERESCNLLSSSLRGYASSISLVASESTHLPKPLEPALHHELGCHRRT